MHELLMFFPNLAGLLWRVLRDPTVSKGFRLHLFAMAAYIVVPFDFIPDFLLGFGQIDDSIALLILLVSLLGGTQIDVLRSHWRGSPRVLHGARWLAGQVVRLLTITKRSER